MLRLAIFILCIAVLFGVGGWVRTGLVLAVCLVAFLFIYGIWQLLLIVIEKPRKHPP